MVIQSFKMLLRPSADARMASPVPSMMKTPAGEAGGRSGLVGRQTYESPQFGVQVTWDHPWAIDSGAAFPIETDTGCQYDTIRLAWERGGRCGHLSLSFSRPADVASMTALVETWRNPAYLARNWDDHAAARLVAGRADSHAADVVFAVIEKPGDGETGVLHRTVALRNDVWLYLTLTADADSVAAVWTALHDGVRVDGEAVPAVLTANALASLR